MNPSEFAFVFDIERFAIHDGPGIRTTVFFQGCGLRCPWCANPESQEYGKPQLLYREDKCLRCRKCERNCRQAAIEFNGKQMVFNRDRCSSCRICSDGCPADAIQFLGERKSTEEIMNVIKRDAIYYKASGGGVTFSGGECLLQADVLKRLLKECRKLQLQTAVETAGDVPPGWLLEIEPWTDLFLYDVKLADPDRLSEVTGGCGQRMLGNFAILCEKVPEKVIARIPVIPGFNYSERQLMGIFEFIHESGGKKVNLLPYHTLGTGKYAQLGRTYSISQSSLSEDDMKRFWSLAETAGLEPEES